ncbi:hypothetical protein ACJMK2_033360, partial [Sinanodonta woodiana]
SNSPGLSIATNIGLGQSSSPGLIIATHTLGSVSPSHQDFAMPPTFGWSVHCSPGLSIATPIHLDLVSPSHQDFALLNTLGLVSPIHQDFALPPTSGL